jgi:hypothetical protein
MTKMYIYFKNGNVDTYMVADMWKAREHSEAIWKGGYRMQVGDRMEWYGPHWIDKICWDLVEDDYLSYKYEGVRE